MKKRSAISNKLKKDKCKNKITIPSPKGSKLENTGLEKQNKAFLTEKRKTWLIKMMNKDNKKGKYR